jgi:hypothetical protein
MSELQELQAWDSNRALWHVVHWLTRPVPVAVSQVRQVPSWLLAAFRESRLCRGGGAFSCPAVTGKQN